MIDFSFHFTESTEEEKLILDSDLKTQGLSNPNIRFFTGRRWNNRGVADGMLYYVEKKKIVFVRRRQKPRKGKLVSDSDFDKKYKIVFIDRFDDNVAHIYEIDDYSYNRVLFSFPGEYTPKDIHVYPFSVGIKKLCIKKQISVCFEKDVPDNRQDFVDYLKRIGCPDIVVDGFIACTAPDIDNDIAPRPKCKNVYDSSGNFLRKESNC